MNEITTGQSIESKNQSDIESIAALIFSRHGIDFATVRRAGGWTNAVWIANELVLRLSTKKGNKNLLREANLSAFFPPEVGYPRVVKSGITEGYSWNLAEKMPGESLGEVWPDLDVRKREIALRGLWSRAQAVHSVPSENIYLIVPRRAWFNSNNPEEADASLRKLTKEEIFAENDAFVLKETLSHFWKVLPKAHCVLCHGDLTLDNAVWYKNNVVALLDFEFAVMAPVELDLNHLVKCAFGPDHHGCDLSPKANQEKQPLRHAVKELAQPILEKPGSKALLVGYAILLELFLLDLWLAHPEGEGPIEQWDPLRRLRLLADGNDGYLAPLFRG